jgi:sporulation protein YlmC with PRC-barrel domain
MRTILLASAAIFALSPMAFAQNAQSTQSTKPAPTQQQNSTTTQQNAANQSTQQKSQQHFGANLKNMLQKSGYTEIRVAPASFMVRAKDENGNPVVMAISPDSFTEITNLSASSGNTTGSATNSSSSERFVSVPQNAEMSSKIVGLNVYNENNKDVGEIKDIALDQNGQTEAYILSVGGFLGMGDHYVAVSPSAVKVTYNSSDKKYHASMNATVDQVKNAPEFKYPNKS